ncbi:flagellin, partial [Janthinobacterium agaricidamnosum]
DAATSISQSVLSTVADAPGASPPTTPLNRVTTQVLTIGSAGGKTTALNVTAGDSAKKIAANINGVGGSTGVTAQASTNATITGIKDGAVQFTLRGSNSLENDSTSQAVTISAKVVGGDLAALAQAINAQTGNTNVTASVKKNADGTKELSLNESSGNDIKIANLGTTAATGLSGASIRGADVKAAVGNTPAQAGVAVNFATADPATGAPSTAVIGGKLDFSSDNGFSIKTSLAGDQSILGADSIGSDLKSVAKLDVSTVAGSNAALLTIDSALNQINSSRASLGAIQNRFASTISNLQTTSENLSASRSRIQDTDFAAETANMTRGQILQQAGTAMLAQANSLPNGVLSLLRG